MTILRRHVVSLRARDGTVRRGRSRRDSSRASPVSHDRRSVVVRSVDRSACNLEEPNLRLAHRAAVRYTLRRRDADARRLPSLSLNDAYWVVSKAPRRCLLRRTCTRILSMSLLVRLRYRACSTYRARPMDSRAN